MNVERPVCRRCHRPLHGALAVAAGVGGRCALLDLIEARGGTVGTCGPGERGGVSKARAASVALVTALGAGVEVSVERLVGDADPVEVAAVLGSALSAALRASLGEEGRTRLLGELGLLAAGAQR
ncbi:hypothetical protein [Streptacidiphilus sp. PAMC 29251]